jgi:NADH dehydrogenase FAD-containing subunit
VRVHTGTRVEAIETGHAPLKRALSDGQHVEADLVISATGVQAEHRLPGALGVAAWWAC